MFEICIIFMQLASIDVNFDCTAKHDFPKQSPLDSGVWVKHNSIGGWNLPNCRKMEKTNGFKHEYNTIIACKT